MEHRAGRGRADVGGEGRSRGEKAKSKEVEVKGSTQKVAGIENMQMSPNKKTQRLRRAARGRMATFLRRSCIF